MAENASPRRRGYTDKIIDTNERLGRIISGLKEANHRIVVTVGTWDILHVGHLRYLIEAKQHGDILVVGVDSDRVVRALKGESRPYQIEQVRCEMLSYQATVDFVIVIDDVEVEASNLADRHPGGRWRYGLLRAINPHVFIAEESSYEPRQLEQIKLFCDELITLKRQAPETSTTQLVKQLEASGPTGVVRRLHG